jgi:hypothetical protein
MGAKGGEQRIGKEARIWVELPPLLEAFLGTGSLEGIEHYLAERSNLPGLRATSNWQRRLP